MARKAAIDFQAVQIIAREIEADIFTDNVIDQAIDIGTTVFDGKSNKETTAILFVMLVSHLRLITEEQREQAGLAVAGLLMRHLMKDDDN